MKKLSWSTLSILFAVSALGASVQARSDEPELPNLNDNQVATCVALDQGRCAEWKVETATTHVPMLPDSVAISEGKALGSADGIADAYKRFALNLCGDMNDLALSADKAADELVDRVHHVSGGRINLRTFGKAYNRAFDKSRDEASSVVKGLARQMGFESFCQ